MLLAVRFIDGQQPTGRESNSVDLPMQYKTTNPNTPRSRRIFGNPRQIGRVITGLLHGLNQRVSPQLQAWQLDAAWSEREMPRLRNLRAVDGPSRRADM
jgi:hypothetical protein